MREAEATGSAAATHHRGEGGHGWGRPRCRHGRLATLRTAAPALRVSPGGRSRPRPVDLRRYRRGRTCERLRAGPPVPRIGCPSGRGAPSSLVRRDRSAGPTGRRVRPPTRGCRTSALVFRRASGGRLREASVSEIRGALVGLDLCGSAGLGGFDPGKPATSTSIPFETDDIASFALARSQRTGIVSHSARRSIQRPRSRLEPGGSFLRARNKRREYRRVHWP